MKRKWPLRIRPFELAVLVAFLILVAIAAALAP